MEAQKSSQKLTNFVMGSASSALNEKVIKAELFSCFICKHNLPIATADHAGMLFKSTFPDSKIVQKCACGRTKTTHIFSGAIAKESIENLKSSLNSSDLCKWYGIATDIGVVTRIISFFQF